MINSSPLSFISFLVTYLKMYDKPRKATTTPTSSQNVSNYNSTKCHLTKTENISQYFSNINTKTEKPENKFAR